MGLTSALSIHIIVLASVIIIFVDVNADSASRVRPGLTVLEALDEGEGKGGRPGSRWLVGGWSRTQYQDRSKFVVQHTEKRDFH